MNITVTDEITGQTATIEHYDLADTLTAWNPSAPAEVVEVIADLQDKINAHHLTQPLQGEVAYLAITITAA